MKTSFHKEVDIPCGNVHVSGELIIPENSGAIIIFSHGSGSSRFSPRNKRVATCLQKKKFGTLLFDLLTEEEDRHYQNRFDIELLTNRLVSAAKWLEKFPPAKDCHIGFFGASTGAASAIKAAARIKEVGAVVSRGGRPDLARESLREVDAPVLLIVGSLDYDVLDLNQEAFAELTCEKKLHVVEGATHLFEEPGMLDKVCSAAGDWFEKYLQTINAIK